MNYNEKVQWLIHYDNKNINSPEILRRASIIKDDVREFELKVFENILNSIKNEKMQIKFLEEQKNNEDSNDMFKAYCSYEIGRHKEIIQDYGTQVLSLYSREEIINFYQKRKEVCVDRINYANNRLKENQNDRVSQISLKDAEVEMSEINFALNILNGTDIDLLNVSIPVSEIGKKIN